MIHPRRQWCIQACVSSFCRRSCANCTRLLAHEPKRYNMSLDHFEQCMKSVCDFPTDSEPDVHHRRKVVGMFGGEPLLHPQFPDLVELMCQYIPNPAHRGLWTGEPWTHYKHPKYGESRSHVLKLLGPHPTGATHAGNHQCGYLNYNLHGDPSPPNDLNIVSADNGCHSKHQPILVAIDEVVEDDNLRWKLIQDCWVQRDWSAAYAYDSNDEPKFYFCEVASAIDRVFRLGLGLPVEPGVWRGDISFSGNTPHGPYRFQIEEACLRCGVSLPFTPRLDSEDRDDISAQNLGELDEVDSPRVKKGHYVLFDSKAYDVAEHLKNWKPECYIQRD